MPLLPWQCLCCCCCRLQLPLLNTLQPRSHYHTLLLPLLLLLLPPLLQPLPFLLLLSTHPLQCLPTHHNQQQLQQLPLLPVTPGAL